MVHELQVIQIQGRGARSWTFIIPVCHMGKQSIGAKEVVADIKSGMTDAELGKKYGLSSKGLESLFRKLVTAKLLDESYVLKRSATEAASGLKRSAAEAAEKAPETRAVPCSRSSGSGLRIQTAFGIGFGCGSGY